MGLIFKGKYFKLYQKDRKLPNGDVMKLDIIEQKHAVVIIPILSDGRIALTREYRAIVKKWLYQLPAGTIEYGEKPMPRAHKELEEEAGYLSGSMKYLFKSYASPGRTTELRYFFIATKLKKVKQRLERHEIIDVKPVTLEKALSMIRNNTIMNGSAIEAILYYDSFVHKKK